MPEQFLDLPQIRAHIQKVGRVAMPQSMRMDVLVQIRTPSALAQDSACFPCRESPRFFFPPHPQ